MKMWREIIIALIIAGLIGITKHTFTVSNEVTANKTGIVFILKTLDRMESKLDRLIADKY